MSRSVPETSLGIRSIKPSTNGIKYRYRGGQRGKMVHIGSQDAPDRDRLPLDYVPYDRQPEYNNKGRGGIGYG